MADETANQPAADPFDTALAQMVAMLDANGDGVVDQAEMRAGVATTAPQGIMPERQMRRLVNKQRAGVPLTPDEMEALAAHNSRQQVVSDQAADVGAQGLAELTGIPSVMRGVESAGRAYNEGSMAEAGRAASEIGLGMLPGGMIARGPVGAAVRGALGSAPRTVATTTGLGALALPAQVEDAQGASEAKISQAINSDPEVMRLRAERDKILAQRTAVNDKYARSGPVTQKKALEPFDALLAAMDGTAEQPGQIGQAENRVRSEYLQNAPFRERNPGVAETMFYGGMGAAAALPFANTIKGNIANRFAMEPAIARQTQAVEQAMIGGTKEPNRLMALFGAKPTTVTPNQGAFAREQDVLKRQLQTFDANQPSYLKNAALGTGLVMESRMLPEEIDAISFPYGHPTRDAATEALTSPAYYASGVIPSLLGGAGAAAAGTKIADTMTRKTISPRIDRARSAAEWDFASQGPKQVAPQPVAPALPPGSQPGQNIANPALAAPGAQPIQNAQGNQPLGVQDQSASMRQPYSSLPQPVRQSVRDAYVVERSYRGEDLPARATSAGMTEALRSKGYNVSVSQARVKTTNDEVNKFVAANGRQPTTKDDWAQIFSRVTLAVPVAAAGGAAMTGNPLIDIYGE